MIRKAWQYKSGFTLIELLIVVAIIGILAAVVSANFFTSIERADAAACQVNLRTLHQSLMSYRVDYGKFPLADCVADTKPRSDATAWGCGPAANGYWCGIPLILVEKGYCQETSMYCPALKRQHDHPITAYSGCGDSDFAGKEVPGWKFFRFAYNSAASDVGGYEGGQHNIEENWDPSVWLIRCAHIDSSEFDPERAFTFPFRIKQDENDPGYTWYGEFELTIHGTVQQRAVQRRRSS